MIRLALQRRTLLTKFVKLFLKAFTNLGREWSAKV